MAEKKDKDMTTTILWVAGSAAVTAFAMYQVNRHLNERDELKKLRYSEEMKKQLGKSSDD